MRDKIIEGDKVNVFFNRAQALFDVEVLYIPQDTGDSWRLRSELGQMYYVQNFELIELKEIKCP